MSLRHRRPATGLVEYGLVLGAVAVLVIVGLNSMSRAQAGYFAALEPSVAAPPAAAVSGPRHTTSVVLGPPCPSSVTAGATFSCKAFVQDTSTTVQSGAPGLTAPSAPTGTITRSLNGVSRDCPVALAAVAADTAACTSPPMSVASPGTVTLKATYNPSNPALESGFLGESNVTTITVLAPTPTPTPTPLPTATPTPLPTATPTPTPTPCGSESERCEPRVVQQPGAEVGYVPASSTD